MSKESQSGELKSGMDLNKVNDTLESWVLV